MVRFQYQIDQDTVELQACNWFGMERLIVNGEQVAKRININNSSSHHFQLSSGKHCRFQMFVDPVSDLLICRIYKNETLLASLKQGRQNRAREHKKLNTALIILVIIFGIISIF
ncbi:hypothetical protein D5018_17535 [Parashewanella curva]|uniref:Uncharacterized protein n=1 Tax=Parashewanella curva TaxID=2338552 RepID=A0A3L8PU93_9GAMM|nr:hypothetical protein [Parashewanella curva]RLV58389.1 hypothetical protein D5018_17535 [Parashewanella curva]